jgi:hypothetical protein
VASDESQRLGDDSNAKKDEELDAGTVTGVGTSDPLTVSVRDQIRREQAKTTSYLAYALIATLLLSVIGHYTTTLVLHLAGKSEVAKVLSDIYEKWLPVITGFTGSAVTYFLTRER